LKRLADILSDELLDKGNNSLYWQWYSVALDSIDGHLFKNIPTKSKKEPPKDICKINFDNKAIEMINMSAIFRNPLATVAKSFETPTVVFDLQSPIPSKIFNFDKFVSYLDVKKFLLMIMKSYRVTVSIQSLKINTTVTSSPAIYILLTTSN